MNHEERVQLILQRSTINCPHVLIWDHTVTHHPNPFLAVSAFLRVLTPDYYVRIQNGQFIYRWLHSERLDPNLLVTTIMNELFPTGNQYVSIMPLAQYDMIRDPPLSAAIFTGPSTHLPLTDAHRDAHDPGLKDATLDNFPAVFLHPESCFFEPPRWDDYDEVMFDIAARPSSTNPASPVADAAPDSPLFASVLTANNPADNPAPDPTLAAAPAARAGPARTRRAANARRFPCTVPGCQSQAFTRQSDLRRHCSNAHPDHQQ